MQDDIDLNAASIGHDSDLASCRWGWRMESELRYYTPQLHKKFLMKNSDGRDFVLLTALQAGIYEYEKPLPKLIVSYLANNHGTFIDVGANTGLYTLLAASVSSDIRVIAFEPMPEIFSKLCDNVNLNRALSGQITAVPAALSRGAGKHVFYQTINDKGFLSTSSTLEIEHAKVIGAEFVSTEVSTVSLDLWTSQHSIESATMIKVDVEGHEQAVLEGGAAFVGRTRPLIIVELLKQSNFDFFAVFMSKFNYLNFVLYPDTIELSRSIEFDPRSWHHILCPMEKGYQLAVAAKTSELELR